MTIKLRFSFFAILLLVLVGVACADVPVPALNKAVTDLTGTLDPIQQQGLEQKLVSFAREKGSQVAVLIVPTTQPETIEQYGIRVVEAWKLGRERQDDGVLLLVAKNDRTLRIEVGHGLEGALTDATSKRIIEEIILPLFKQGNFFAGISAGLDAIMKVITGENLPAPAFRHSSSGASSQSEFSGSPFILILIFGAFIANAIKKAFGTGLGTIVIGILGFVVGLIFLPVFLAAFLSLAVMIASFFNLFEHGGHYSRHGGWSRGGGFGGGFGGGGFSGGGGSFGGGGASGRW